MERECRASIHNVLARPRSYTARVGISRGAETSPRLFIARARPAWPYCTGRGRARARALAINALVCRVLHVRSDGQRSHYSSAVKERDYKDEVAVLVLHPWLILDYRLRFRAMTDRQALLQAISKTTGASHYVVQFEVDQCISVVPRKRLLDPPVPSVGDECRVEWSGDEYTAKILAMGDEQQARKAECEYLKALSHSSENEHHQPPAKKRRLLKKKKTATSLKPKKNSKPVAAKAKKGKNADFVLDLGSPSKEENDKHQEKNNNQIKQGGLGNQGGERELHVPRSEKQHASPSQSNNQPGGLSNQGGETELHVPRSEKQHAGTSQSGKQPDVEEGHLSTFSFSSSSGDDSDEMYIGQTTPKKVLIIVYDLLLVLCTCMIVCTHNLHIILLCTGYYHL